MGISPISYLFNGNGGTNDYPQSLVHLLRQRSAQLPDQIIHTYLPDGETPGPVRSFGLLDQYARGVAVALEAYTRPGDRVLLFFPPGLEFLDAFFGCLYSGRIAVPTFPPNPAQLEQTLFRLQMLAVDAQASLILTTRAVKGLCQAALETHPPLNRIPWLDTDGLPLENASAWQERLPEPQEVAYFQYTSGSTRNPRGVCLSHTNLAHNSARISQAFQLTSDDIAVIWLPMYHNMGLVGGLLQPFFSGLHCYLMSPQAFLENPALWLKAITKYKATVSGGPNFAYDLCTARIPAEQRQGLDLSSWNLAFNGAEAVHPGTLQRFAAVFGPYGFSSSAFYPCYGLAEATLLVTNATRSAGPVIERVDPAALEKNEVRRLPAGSAEGQPIVSCGHAFPDQETLIVDPERLVPLEEEQVGEIWVRGPSVSPGYWNHPQESSETFQGFLSTTGAGPYLRTGDLGYLSSGECFITGRLKELIIIRGRNLYPQDIEQAAVSSHPALIRNGSAAFSIEADGEEKLALVQEIDPRGSPDFEEVVRNMRQAISKTYNIQLYAILLAAPGSIARTISGKIQRQPMRKLYLDGKLQPLYTSVMKAEPAAQKPAGAESAAQPLSENLLHAALIALGPEKSKDLLEAYLRTRISQVLKVPASAIEAQEPLTSLGLDSITSIELAASIKDAVGVQIPLAEVLKGASLAELIKWIIQQLSGAGEPAASSAQKVEEPAAPEPLPAQEYPLSYGQRALWFIQQLHPEDVAHNIVYAVSLHAELDPAAFKRALRKLSFRHPALRTRFLQIDGQPVQRVEPGSDYFEFSWEDATAWSAEDLEKRLEQEVYRPFNLETGPLVRYTFLNRGPQETILILAMHHIITDLWSTTMIAYDMMELYGAEVQHREPSLKAIKETYSDAIRREAERMSGPEGEQHLAYWRERLSGDLPAMKLPTDHPRPAMLSARAATRNLDLDAALFAKVKALAEKHQTNLFSTLLSAFYTLLYRYTGQRDLLVGTPKAGRTHQNATTVGYFINPVILREQVSSDMRFSDLLAQVTRDVQADFQHDVYPFPLLVEKLQPERSLGTNPLLQIFFSWQKTHRMMDSRLVTALTMNETSELVEMSGVPLRTLPLKARVTTTDLALLVAESEGALRMTIEFSTELFDGSTIEHMLGHLETLLNAVSEDPDQTIGRAPILTGPEKQQILVDWNTPSLAVEETLPIHTLIERQAAQTPHSIAVEAGGQCLTYQELVQQAHALAGVLKQAGAGTGKIVGLCAERSPEMIIGLLAILETGSAYLPLDPDYPSERLAFMLADSNAAVIVTQSWLKARLPLVDQPVICLDAELKSIAGKADVESAPVCMEDLAYVMYTSGSTGQPKGVLVPHRAIAKHCAFMKAYYQVVPEDRYLQFASLNFDASLEQIFTALISGAALVLRDNNLWDPAEFSQKISDLRLTIVNVPPAYWNQWVAAEAKVEAPLPNAQLRLLIVGGDVLRQDTLLLWQQTHLAAARLINAYGPTEAIITATAYDVPHQPLPPGTSLPIGRPMAGRSAYILDDQQQPVPAGVPGELLIGGDCLAEGYHNRPDLTAEKFIPDPFAANSQARLYCTGDLARYHADGNIEFLGRVDRQVKILGIRIEPGEIEAALKQHPGITDAVVLITPQPNSQLIACLIACKAVPERAELTSFMARRLPQYMIPADFIAFDAFPLTPSGKLDRDALGKAAEKRRANTAQGYVQPRNETEEYLATLWARLIGVPKVGIYDNFFALGGHSLLATQVMSRVRDHYQVDIPLRDLFEAPTVANLALAIVGAMAEQERDEDLEALLAEIEDLPDDGNASPPAQSV